VVELADEGLVETWIEGKTKHVRITLAGELLLRSGD
jgi:predicted transcriptional regulator